LSRPDPTSDSPFARDGNAPPFNEAWEAQAFALTHQLYEAGHFTWQEWTETFAAVIADADRANPARDGSDYYSLWLTALERITTGKDMTRPEELSTRRDAWERAYATTPHGKPVTLDD
jgi:nitrile hydratase accessory protein